MALLRVDHASKAFGETVLFEDLSLQVTPGDVVYLRGPNGSGKSTFLRGLRGQVPFDRGHVLLPGGSSNWLTEWQMEELLPMVDQEPCLEFGVRAIDHLVDTVTVGKGWRWLLTLSGTARRRARDLMAAEMEQMGLTAFIDRPTIELSYGQQKLLTLVRALRPLPGDRARVLLLDEPLAGLRPILFEPLLSLLRERLVRGWAILVVEHLHAIHELGEGREILFPVVGDSP